MKLKKIEVSSANRSHGRALLTVSKSGKFSLSPSLREKIGYEPGKKINFFQDEDVQNGKDWYISLSEDEGTPLRESAIEKYTSVFIQKSGLAEQMRKIFNAEGSMLFSVGLPTELGGVNYWPLLFNK